MNNERIDEVLDDNIVAIEGGMRDRIRKAMEQYGLEQSKDGYVSGSDAVHKILKPEIDRLRELVKAQKELIALYDEENLSDPAWLKESELRKQIKTLEQ